MKNEELLNLAKKVREKAFAPYSKFKVGAALLTKSGEVFTGCNVECTSYGLTICAERVALTKAVSEGFTEFAKIAVVADTKEPCSPCGACRQFLHDFGDFDVILSNLENDTKEITIAELLPFGFKDSDLQKWKSVF